MAAKFQGAAKRKLQIQYGDSKSEGKPTVARKITDKVKQAVDEVNSPANALAAGHFKAALLNLQNLKGQSTKSKLKKMPPRGKPVNDVGMFRYLEPSKNPYGWERDF